MALMFIGEAFVTAVIGKVVDKGFEYVKDQCEWESGMKTELGKLQYHLPQISAVVKVATNIRDNDDLKEWLWQLKDAVYDAEDVLEDLEYLRIENQVETANIGYLSQPLKKLKRAFEPDPVLKKLREVVRNLDKVAAGVDNFLQLTALIQQQRQHQQLIEERNRETGCLHTVRRFFGREKETEELVRLLTMDHQDRLRVINLCEGNIMGHAMILLIA